MESKRSNQQKGDSFENLVFLKLKELIKRQSIPGVTQHNEIFLHKQYASKSAPDVMLNPDITIEVYSTPSKKTWSCLLVFECKNHKRRIDHSIYREFIGNLADYPRSGVRGIMISSAGFTEEVIKLAQSDNIALAVLTENSDWRTIIWRQINNLEQNLFYLKVMAGKESANCPLVYLENSFTTIYDLLQECGIHMPKALQVPYLEKNDIRKIVNEALLSTGKFVNKSFLDRGISQIAADYKFDFVEMQENFLGKCDFTKRVITINSTLCEHRRNFTIAHELGHIALHSSIVENLLSIEDYESGNGLFLSSSTNKRMELQANIFASYLLMPDIPFIGEVDRLFKENWITKGRLFLDSQPCNKRDCYAVIGALSSKFNVSKEAVIVRLKQENLFTEE